MITSEPVLWLKPHRRAMAPWVALAVAAFGSSGAQAQSAAVIANLSFGAFVVAGAGQVLVSANGERTATGGVYLMRQGGTASAGRFALAGSPYASYIISLPANGEVSLSDGQGHTMALASFVSNPSGSGVLLGNGTGEITLGATLQVGFAQARGNYTGTFSITLNYQ
jgi:hypothetical protein